MQSTVGLQIPLSLDRPVDEALLGQVESRLAELVEVPSQAATISDLMAAFACCPPGEAIGVPALRKASTPPRPLTARRIRHLLDAGGSVVDELRGDLVASAVAAGPEAAYLECHEVSRKGADSYDVVTLSLLGSGFCVPVGWARAWSPDNPGPAELGAVESERATAAILIGQLCDDLEAKGLTPDFAPLFASDSRYGESVGLRMDLANLGLEYALEVGSLYRGAFPAPVNPDDPLAAGPELAERMPFGPQGGLPDPFPIPVDGDSAPNGEFVAPLRRAGTGSYAVARPGGAAREAGLVGHRGLTRARELGEMSAAIDPPRTARNLRLADLRYASERGWQATAAIVSVLYAALQGVFPGGGA